MTTRYAWASRTGWLTLALILGLAPTLASAAVFNPSPATADGAAGSLRDAIAQANANSEDDTINLAAGTYSLTLAGSGEDANASGDLDLTEAGFTVYLYGAGATQTFIDQDTADRVIQIFSGVTVVFRDLTITGGDVSTSGGGIMNAGNATLNNTTVLDNVARGAAATDGGGGIYNNGGTVTLVNRAGVRNNRASGASGSGGGVFNYGGTFSANGARIAGNRANRAGGGIEGTPGPAMRSSSGGPLFAITLTNTDLNNNIAGPTGSANPGNGGGLHITGDVDVQIVGGTVRNNFAAREGGGLWNGSGTMDLDNVSITTNAAAGPAADDGGGGVFNNGGLVDIDGGVISGNTATGAAGSGGGIHNRGFLEVTGTMISGNSSQRAGGGIEDTGAALMLRGGTTFTAVLDGVTLSGNNAGTSPGNGGGLHSGGGNVAVGGSTVTMNTAVEGGGLWSNGFLDVENTSISDNTATGSIATKGGGGVFNSGGTVEIEGGSIAGNTASVGSGSGGGVFHLGGTTTINGTTISGNAASRAGGGLEAAVGGVITLTNVDFTANTTGSAPGNGGALHVTAGTVNATGGSVADNVAASEGGGFWNNAGWTMTVDGTSFSNNDAQGAAADNGGGGLFNNGGTLVVMNATVSGNMASGTSGSGGGLFNFGGRMEITDTMISSNTANRAGGGIEDTAGGDGTFIAGTTISGNNAGASPGNGGGIHSGGGYVNMSSGEVSGNTAVEGGGLWTSGTMEVGDGGFVIVFPTLTGEPASGDASKGLPDGAVIVTGNTATGNSADQGGGGLYNDGGTMTLASVLVANNQATGTSGSGGGLLNNNGTLTVNTSAFMGNTANRAGGGIEDANAAMRAGKSGGPDVVIDGSLFLQNNAGAAPGNGGGLHVGGPGQVAITMSGFAENMAVEGGGVWNSGAGSMRIATTTLIGNTATQGGGLYQSGTGGTMFVEQSLVALNSATAGGGGQIEGGDVTFVNSTISSNSAVRGGGLRQLDGAVSLGSVTVARNDASTRGGGLRIAGGTMSVQNTIIGENTSPQGRSCSGTIVSLDYNLIESRAGCNITGDVAHSQTNVLAMFDALADNGGPTRTHALLAGSPAINAGQTVETVDQRGFLREDGQDDMGAFEFGATPPVEEAIASSDDAPAEATETAEVAGSASLVTMTEPVRLDAVAPNPLRAGRSATVSFAVREAQTVEVALYDATGRRVATVYSGAPEGSQLQTAALQTGDLASGIYVLRLSGETVQATQMVTLVR